MGDDSKIVVGASASTTKEERHSGDYSTPITSDKLDGSNYASWSREDNCLVQSWLLNSMTKPVRALFEHGATAFDIWEAARKTYTVTQNSSRPFQLRRQSILTCRMVNPSKYSMKNSMLSGRRLIVCVHMNIVVPMMGLVV
ncbi:unnamed protein product [Prunus brigantina]